MLEPRRVQPVPWQRHTLAEGKRATRFVTSRWATQCQHQWVAAMMLCGYGAGQFASNACVSTPYISIQTTHGLLSLLRDPFLDLFCNGLGTYPCKSFEYMDLNCRFFVGGLKQGIGKFARCKLPKNPVQFMLFSRALTFSRGKTCKKVRAKGIATYVRGTEEWPGTFL